MKYISYCLVFVCMATSRQSLLLADDLQTYTFASQRKVGHVDHVNILLELSGDVLEKSGTSEKPEHSKVSLTCRRDYEEKTLQLPTAADKTLRGVRYYHEAWPSSRKRTSCRTPP